MKTKSKHLILILTLGTSLLLAVGCGKSDRENVKQAATDNAVTENAFNDIFNQVDKAARQQSTGGKEMMADCPVITVSITDTITFPKTITLDFGTGCTDAYGTTRAGKIIFTLSGRYRDAGTVINVSLENYSRNGNSVSGTKTVTNMGKNGSDHTYFTVEVSGASVVTDDGTISWTSSRQREWIEGEDTWWPNWQDDAYLITGSANGTTATGKNFTISITNALRIELDCHWIVSGTIEMDVEGAVTRSLDYGSGDCDDKAILTIGNKTYEVTLH